MAQQEWLVQVVVLASEEEKEALMERMGEVICAPADHEGRCVTPWTMMAVPVADLPKKERAGWRALLDEE